MDRNTPSGFGAVCSKGTPGATQGLPLGIGKEKGAGPPGLPGLEIDLVVHLVRVFYI